MQLLKLDGDETIPYPLRGTHLLPKIEGTEDQQKEIKKAHKYAGVGCWSTAADLFQSLGNTLPNSAEKRKPQIIQIMAGLFKSFPPGWRHRYGLAGHKQKQQNRRDLHRDNRDLGRPSR